MVSFSMLKSDANSGTWLYMLRQASLSLLGGASVGSGTVYWLIIAQFSCELRALSLHQTIYGFKS